MASAGERMSIGRPASSSVPALGAGDAEQATGRPRIALPRRARRGRGSRPGAARTRCRRTRSDASSPDTFRTVSPIGDVGLREHLLDGAADHHADDLVLAASRRQEPGADGASVAEDRETFGDLVDLFELVADEQDRLPLPLQPLDDAEEILDLLVGQGRRRLVHDDDAGLDRERPRDGDEVALRDRKVLQPGIGADRRVDRGGAAPPRARSWRAQFDKPEPVRGA